MTVVQWRRLMLETQPRKTAQPPAPAPAPGEPARGELELSAVLHALSDPVRLQILAALSDGAEHSCGSFKLPVTKSTCTHHFRVLREAGVIHQRHEGTSRLNSLRSEDLEARFPGLLGTVLRAAAGA
jgi:DNA-binding transcriptional ArsR family regulator